MPANLKTQQRQQDWKRSVFIPILKKGNTKECSDYHTLAFILHVSSKSFKPYFQMYKLDLEKAEDSETKLPTSVGSYKKQENSRNRCFFWNSLAFFMIQWMLAI